VFDGEQLDSNESAAQAKAREKKRLKDERRAKRAEKAAAQEERRRKREEEAEALGNGHTNGVDRKATKKKKSKKSQKNGAASSDGDKDDDEDDAPFAVDEGVVLDDDELGAAGDGQADGDDVENDPAYQEFLRQVAIEEDKVNRESGTGNRRKKGAK
jgi:hypothetical protein